jgi:glycosyltransferase involved in cell wall biosynthesis
MSESSPDELPIHFFTIVLNGEPFVRYHFDIFRQLPFRWHWHVVEGVAALKHDTAWSARNGGRIPDGFHDRGRSNDGTTGYLDRLAADHPDRVSIYRKPAGVFWDGKREMVNAPLPNITEECLLWQVDADELWTPEQFAAGRQLFLDHPGKTAAKFWCWFFVGKDLVVSTRNCYSQDPRQEWLRTWRYRPGMRWQAHEPPRLVSGEGGGRDVAEVDCFGHDETERHGLVFQHFAYAVTEQLLFKEGYYGYRDAFLAWSRLQRETVFPCRLGKYLPWVSDDTSVDRAAALGVVPLARPDSGGWCFGTAPAVAVDRPFPKVVVDGVFFQMGETGIARVWRSLLDEWSRSEFGRHLVLLDRARTAPEFPGIRRRLLPRYEVYEAGRDSHLLQDACDEEGADLFVSTYYTTPLTTASMHLAHDMIPEVRGGDLNAPIWKEKRYSILHAAAFLAVSEHTARDLVRCFPHIQPRDVTVAPNGVSPVFRPAPEEDIAAFTARHRIDRPYFLVVGERIGTDGYKNTALFFRAFARLPDADRYAIVCTGGKPKIESELARLVPGRRLHRLQLADVELRTAYSGAVALVYPSRYEGFGLPVAEAMACGCPVVTCRLTALPEVAGEAAMYVGGSDEGEMLAALTAVQKPEIRRELRAAGVRRAANFSWARTAEVVSDALTRTAHALREGRLAPPPRLWTEFRDLQTVKSPAAVYLLGRAVRALRPLQFSRLRMLWERSKGAFGLRNAG